MRKKPNAITQATGFAAVAVITAVLCRFVPMVVVLYYFMPMPMALLAKRFRLRAALIPAIAASGVLFLLMPPLMALEFALYLLAVGGVISFAYAKNVRGFYKLAAAYVAQLVMFIAAIAIYQASTGKAFSDQIVAAFRESIKNAAQMSDLMDAANITQAAGTLIQQVKLLMPSVVLITPFFAAWILLLICDHTLKTRGIESSPVPPLSHWFMPRSASRFLLIILLVVFIANFTSGAQNIYIVTLTQLTDFAFGIMGLSFLFWVFNRRRNRESTGVKVVILVICAFLYVIMAELLPLIGIIDVYSNMRLHIMLRDKRR